MAPALLHALSDAWPCPLCGSRHVTIAREQDLVLTLAQGELAAYEVLSIAVTACCDRCRELIYERVERVGGADVYRAEAPPEPAPAPPTSGRFAFVEVD